MLCNVLVGLAQPVNPLRLTHFSSTHKLPGVSVQCIYEDHMGILWLGIESLGLTRYDGKTYEVYKNKADDPSSISNNYPARIVEDLQGNIWVATKAGLNRFNRETETFTRYYVAGDDPYSLSNNALNDIRIDRFGNVWVATANGISVYNARHDEFLRVLYNSIENRQSDNIEVNAIQFDDQSNVWIGTNRFGLYMIPNDAYTPLMEAWQHKPLSQLNSSITTIHNWVNNTQSLHSLAVNSIRCLAPMGTDTVWVGTQMGLFAFQKSASVFHKQTFAHVNMQLLNKATYLDLYVDSNRNLWAGTSNDGLMMIQQQTKHIHYLNADFEGSHNLKSNAIRNVIETRSGLIWVATKFEGLHSYDPRQNNFALINKATNFIPGLSHEYVLCVFEDSRNVIWIGTKAGGLTRWDRQRNTFEYFKHDAKNPGSIGSNRIEMMIEDSQGNLWLAHENGLDCLPPGSKEFKHYLSNHFRTLCLTKSGILWLGTNNGIYKFDTQTRQAVVHKTVYSKVFNSENNLDVTRIIEDRSGVLWFGTGKDGLYEYNPIDDRLIIHTHSQQNVTSVSGNMIRGLYQDSQGNIWVGTKSDGFNRFDKASRTFVRYQNPNPQSSNTYYNFLEDVNGNLWMGTHKGIERFSPKDSSFTLFNSHYGLQSLIFDSNAYGYTHDGFLMLGGSKGLNIFSPEKVKYLPDNSPIMITSVMLDNKHLARDIQESQLLRVSYRHTTLSFEFALLNYLTPDENTYAYQLENFDKDWVYCDTRNFASYTNLPPGDYVFKVKGANSEGIWSSDIRHIAIRVDTPFWRAWWFILLAVVFGGSCIWLVIRLRVSMIRRNEARLKEQVRQRTADLSQAYEKLEKVNRQIEIRNNELLYQSKKIRSQNQELERHHQNLEQQVIERTRDLEKSKQKAEESDQLKSAFLANMSHEIRTPLNAIIGFSDLITSDDVTPEERTYMNRVIQNNSNSLLQLINDIVDISMIEANQLPISITQFNLGIFLHDVANDARKNKALIEKGLTLNLEIEEPLNDRMFNSAPERIRQIFQNLISNAIKFTDQGGITIGCQAGVTEGQYLFYVRDTGCGILKSQYEAIFERFRKFEDSTSRLYRGTGLGLSICRHICQLLGGKIWVESIPDRGATFYFSLPDRPMHATPKVKATGPQRIVYPDWAGKTILIAEDEDSNFEVLRYSLLRTHIRIVRAVNGVEAVDYVMQSSNGLPDLVLMDIKMPVMDGMEASAKIKERHPNLPVIAQTGYAIPLDERDMTRAHFDGFVTKPIATRKLLEKMQQLMPVNQG